MPPTYPPDCTEAVARPILSAYLTRLAQKADRDIITEADPWFVWSLYADLYRLACDDFAARFPLCPDATN